MRVRGTRPAHGVAAAATLVAVLLSGCGSNPAAESTPTPAPTTASPSPTPDPAQVQARTSVLAVYEQYRMASVAAAATSDYNSTDLARYTADPLLTQLRQNLRQKYDGGLITKGTPKWNPRVTVVNVTIRPFTATIEDCFDATGWDTVYKATGKPAAVPGQAKRSLVTAEAALYDDGRWLIRASAADRTTPC